MGQNLPLPPPRMSQTIHALPGNGMQSVRKHLLRQHIRGPERSLTIGARLGRSAGHGAAKHPSRT
jgi:hypothetical protein